MDCAPANATVASARRSGGAAYIVSMLFDVLEGNAFGLPSNLLMNSAIALAVRAGISSWGT
jgi:hypothetical protein